MRVVAMATGPFAVPTLQSLATRDDVQIIALVSRPPRQQTSRAMSNPAVLSARASGIDVVTPPTVNADAFLQQLEQWRPDLLFVCDYGEILSATTIGKARLGGINLHGSLLPEFRGAAPVAWAILHGRSETGVSVIHMTPRLDAGPILTQARLTINPNDDALSLEARLAELGVTAVDEAIEMLRRWDEKSPLGTPQDSSQATRAPRLKREDGRIDWNRSSCNLFNQVRGLQPWPGTFTYCQTDATDSLRLQVLAASLVEGRHGPAEHVPGTVIDDGSGEFLVATGDGILRIDRVRPQDRKAISGAEFRRGYRIVGERLGEVRGT